eukprot:gnl/TRDRNA2_/TRDRNA2_197205_c0_seq1.p1 gnl/TRDRNA2_/TRDRNA2_197205_c0~~gnl/TRDRNA2_/TRDRNA2_197205_c0_seq1.p1  ORF type:complete len:364 (-),score=93.37 gnl/TRDRNA2_/TRDRNA2_197205_c0_seq1:53-1144(-)
MQMQQGGCMNYTGHLPHQGSSALISGGMGGLGLIASRELAMNGHNHVFTVSRSGLVAPFLESQVMLDVLQENCAHHNVRADFGDGSVTQDVMAHINNQQFLQTNEKLVQVGGNLVLDKVLARLRELMNKGEDIGAYRLERVKKFVDQVGAIFLQHKTEIESQKLPPEDPIVLASSAMESTLKELYDLIKEFTAKTSQFDMSAAKYIGASMAPSSHKLFLGLFDIREVLEEQIAQEQQMQDQGLPPAPPVPSHRNIRNPVEQLWQLEKDDMEASLRQTAKAFLSQSRKRRTRRRPEVGRRCPDGDAKATTHDSDSFLERIEEEKAQWRTAAVRRLGAPEREAERLEEQRKALLESLSRSHDGLE